MAQVLWNVVRKNSVFSNISDVEYLFCSQRNLSPSNWPWAGSAANLKKKEKNHLLTSPQAACENYNAGRKNLLQNIHLTGFIISGLRSVRSFPFICPKLYNWQKPLLKVLVQENQWFQIHPILKTVFSKPWVMEFDCALFGDPKSDKDTTQNSTEIILLTEYICLSRLPEAQILFVFRVQVSKLFFWRS